MFFFSNGTLAPMPVPWVALRAAILLTPAQGVPASQQGPLTVRTYGDLTVEARSAVFDATQPGNRIAVFREGVKATYLSHGLKETLTADSLTLYLDQERGEAAGHVVLLDPDGTLAAENLVFSWAKTNRSGTAKNVHLEVGGVMMEAATAEDIPGEPPTLKLTDVYGTSCTNEHPPLYSIKSPLVTFRPGKEGVIRRPAISLFGRHIITLPTQRFSLDPRVKGNSWPGIAYKKNGQLGIRWSPNYLLDGQTALSGNMRAFPGEAFNADLYVTRSFVDPQKALNPITPRSELSERFGTGYLDNVRVENPESETSDLTEERRTISVGAALNRTSLNDQSDSLYTKSPEVVYEQGGPLGRMGYQFTVRAQNIKREDTPYKQRLMAQATLHPKPIELSRNLFLTSRMDASVFTGADTFGWSRAEAGLVAKPAKWLSLGAGFGYGSESGTPTFPADRLLIRKMAMYRADLDLGPTQISYLLKRDQDRGKWYREFYVSQVMGCLEAFVTSRQFPRSYQLGLTLRLDRFFEVMRNRSRSLKTAEASPGTAHELHR
jgi:hypothetical protein